MSGANSKKMIRISSVLSLLLSGVITFSASFAAEKQKLNKPKDKESYSLGYQFGNNLKSQGLDINPNVYTAGVRDALGGKEPQMKLEEIQATLASLQQKARKEIAAKNLEEGKKFFAENGKKEGVKTLPSGLQYKALSEGMGKKPKAEDTVIVNYKGTFMDGTEFENSYKRGQPVSLKINSVIKGWAEALQLMKEGSKWELFIPPNLAYGEEGAPPRIFPNSVLIFEVELISIQQN
jgi:FKBP-type peptidyl-prolyl cis-trans isomerase FklB